MSVLTFHENLESSDFTRIQVLTFSLLIVLFCFAATVLFVEAMGHHPKQRYEDPPKVSQILNFFAAAGATAAGVCLLPAAAPVATGLVAGLAIFSGAAWLGSAIADASGN